MTTITDLTAQLQSTHFDHIAFFFSKYHDFTYDPNANAASEFQRLAQHRGWGAKKKRTHHARFLKAFGAEFDAVFGAGDEWDWKYLCMLLGVVANSVTHARNVVLRPIRVNIFDLLEYHKAYERCQGQVVNLVPLRKFATVKALAEYSMDNDYEKVYPRKQAKKQGALKFMLRKLFRA